MTNINKGKIEYHTNGDLAKNVIASSSIPLLFTPMEIDGELYVDGGLIDNLPAKPIRDICEKIIAVNISPIVEDYDLNNVLDISVRVFQIESNANAADNFRLCDIVIEPEELAKYNILETKKAKEMFEIGYKAAMKTDFSSLVL